MASAAPPPIRIRRNYLDYVHTTTFTPREYQIELLDSALERNAIICMGTGTGKTFVAVMLIRELSSSTRLNFDEGGKRMLFLAPTVSLVRQQRKVLEDHTDLKVGEYYGAMGIQYWSAEEWTEEVKKKQILVMTPETFKDVMTHKAIPLEKINLLVVDECQLAVTSHIYKDIMKTVSLIKETNRPHILGLSASLLNGNCNPEQLKERIKSLEKILLSRVEAASSLASFNQFISKPKEELAVYPDHPFLFPLLEEMQTHLNSALELFEELSQSLVAENEDLPHPAAQPKRYLMELSYVLVTLGPWCTHKVCSILMMEISGIIPFIQKSEIHLQLLLLARTVLETVSKLCELLMRDFTADKQLFELVHPKLKSLLNILEPYKPEEIKDDLTVNDPADKIPPPSQPVKNRRLQIEAMSAIDAKALCGVIFVKQRVTAYVLSLWLNQVARTEKKFSFLRSNFVVGEKTLSSGRTTLDYTHRSSTQYEETLRKFRTREYNLLVANSVIEEGMDVPRCNLVVRFDLPDDFRSYIQSKGRARAPESKYIFLVDQQEEKFMEQLESYKNIEQILSVQGRDDDVLEEDKEDVSEKYYCPNEKEGAPKVTLSTSIALVNRYCGKLPSDTFTRLTPKWKINIVPSKEGFENMYSCTIELPINSPLKEPITGDLMSSQRLAKMASALSVCKRLHEMKELDDNLLPVGKESVKFEEEMLCPFEVESVAPGAPRPGTTKRRQYYYKMLADALKGDSPSAQNNSCFLYRFSMKLTCPIPEEQNTRGRKIHDPASTAQSFGILTTKSLPQICSFPVFTRSGEVTIELELIVSNAQFNEQQMLHLQNFHRYTFQDVLRLEKYPMVFNALDAENAFYVVPLNEFETGPDIDWSFIRVINEHKLVSPTKATEKERSTFSFKLEDYTDAVVMPWYRNLDKPQFFYVAEICSKLNPTSDFPDFGYETFKDYYLDKYKIKIFDNHQPLLDVDHTSARLNLLTPRYVNRKGMSLPTSSEHTKKAKRENLQQKQILVPELCVVHPFPASLWRKAVCLPCILYRLNSLLLAEQLRIKVACQIGVGMIELDRTFKWPSLDFGWTLADVKSSQQPMKGQKNVNPFQTRSNKIEPSNPWNPQSNLKTDGDLIIDHFDPNKVHIPDDEDLLLDSELAHINFPEAMGGSLSGLNLGSWGNLPSVPAEEEKLGTEVRIRYGSPSNFEGTGWDSEWDMENEEGSSFRISLPGLGYISAPSGFNVQGLSQDLATCRYDDIYDSDFDDDDEEELIFEGEEFRMPPNSEPIVETLPTQDIKAFSKEEGLSSEMFQSEWLSAYSQSQTSNELSLITNGDSVEVKDDTVSFPMIKQAVKSIRESRSEVNETKEDLKNGEAERNITNFSVSAYSVNVEGSDMNSSTSKPAFGDLLPGRDVFSKENGENPIGTDSEIFRVHFDEQPDLSSHPGPSPSVVLQAFTMSNANDGINLERLETVGDSFLKYSITAYLYCTRTDIHEGKLSFLRSKQISNLNLYKLGKKSGLGQLMIASKFEPNDNWLPPCYTVPKGLEQAFIDSGIPDGHWNIGNMKDLKSLPEEEIRQLVMDKKSQFTEKQEEMAQLMSLGVEDADGNSTYIRYNLLTQQSIPDKSIADCVEALIGAYLISCGPRGALLFMSWLGLFVLPDVCRLKEKSGKTVTDEERLLINRYGHLTPPQSPLLQHIPDPISKLDHHLKGFENFEAKIGYRFQDRAYLLQAFTHASYHYNRLTDCYQRLEFLGDAVLDYLITRHLYEDPQQHYPGTLTDLRSALVNNTFFASLAVKYDFHKYFKAISPGLFGVISKFVDMKRNNPGFVHFEEYYLEEEECEEAEEVEVPKALGDIFESVAGAIYLDSGMSLDTVWRVYYTMMKPEIEYFSTHVPKSPIRELLETYPQTARFERAEVTWTGKVRIRVEVVGKGQFVGIGRNKRIAKCTAAKRALRALKKMDRRKK